MRQSYYQFTKIWEALFNYDKPMEQLTTQKAKRIYSSRNVIGDSCHQCFDAIICAKFKQAKRQGYRDR